MQLSHIVACSENGIIGRDGQLPWHLPSDLKRFKALTMGHILIMGRKTFASIGRPLPGRLSIVVTRSQEPLPRIVSPVNSLDAAFAQAEQMLGHWPDEVFIIGGGDVYRQTLPRVSKIYLTRIHRHVDGDVSYPLEALKDFVMTAEEKVIDSDPVYTVQTWERKKA